MLLALSLAADPPADRRVELGLGRLFVPEGYAPGDDGLRLLVHLHGAPETVERELVSSGTPAALVTVTLNGLSGVYTAKLRDPDTFLGLLDEAVRACAATKLARLTVSSFSAGFGGVRELLKDERLFDRIDVLVMADTIYAGYVGDSAEHRVDPANMTGFLRFARAAAAGRKQMLVTHCDLQPEGYASTRETADYLIAQLGATREAADETWTDGWQCTSRYEQGSFRVYGFAGTDGPAHLRHLRHLGLLLKRVR